MKLLLVRHWETTDNLENILTWQKDVKLSEKWKQDAIDLVDKLLNFDIDMIYCSTLKRAVDTINPYVLKYKKDIIYTNQMKEMDLWIYNWSSIDDEEVKIERAKWLRYKAWWWESLVELYDRALIFLWKNYIIY